MASAGQSVDIDDLLIVPMRPPRQRLTEDEWKDVFTASLKQQKVVPGIDGKSFVVCGQRTSSMPKSDFSNLIELIYAFGAENGVNFIK